MFDSLGAVNGDRATEVISNTFQEISAAYEIAYM